MITNEYLTHHGIKGQRWGIRRYQNKDGSLTPAGRKKYYNPDGSLTKAGYKKFSKEYNYKEGDSYKNASEKEKRKRRIMYGVNWLAGGGPLGGKTEANRIEYKVDKDKQSRKKVTAKAFAKIVITNIIVDQAVKLGKPYAQRAIRNLYYSQKVRKGAKAAGVNMKALSKSIEAGMKFYRAADKVL